MTATPVTPPIGREGLRRLSTGLLVYGAIGLAIALLGLIALLYAGNRIGGLADRTSDQVEALIATLDQTAVALEDAGTTADSFAGTLERTDPAIRQAATTIGNLTASLDLAADQLASISILGNRPLEGVATVFAQMSADLDGLDDRLVGIADELTGNRDALLTNAESLTALGNRLETLADSLRTGIIADSLGDVQLLLVTVSLLFVAWTAVPAIGALGVGWWLRTELRRSGPPEAPLPPV